METYYVTYNKTGFIDNWTTEKIDGFLPIQSEPALFTVLNCVRVVDGIAVMDQSQLEREKEAYWQTPPSDLEVVQQENAHLLLYSAELEAVIQQSQREDAELLFVLAEKGVL
ncbi:hypothetical protein PGRAN_11398 [Listeria grandensis FSL F6-0971]|uniref:Uncharacterized protein n=1 Tax=Listeria grandensis FSL F6-0971 TaxID=1265819 RepID=W7BAI3_9LIST|nr:hypothetical protein [Listeria grandensis]EUJ22997.1 hypothetical protein PGRAN_11398 [Listeria grandensis FSL F6-0971]